MGLVSSTESIPTPPNWTKSKYVMTDYNRCITYDWNKDPLGVEIPFDHDLEGHDCDLTGDELNEYYKLQQEKAKLEYDSLPPEMKQKRDELGHGELDWYYYHQYLMNPTLPNANTLFMNRLVYMDEFLQPCTLCLYDNAYVSNDDKLIVYIRERIYVVDKEIDKIINHFEYMDMTFDNTNKFAHFAHFSKLAIMDGKIYCFNSAKNILYIWNLNGDKINEIQMEDLKTIDVYQSFSFDYKIKIVDNNLIVMDENSNAIYSLKTGKVKYYTGNICNSGFEYNNKYVYIRKEDGIYEQYIGDINNDDMRIIPDPLPRWIW